MATEWPTANPVANKQSREKNDMTTIDERQIKRLTEPGHYKVDTTLYLRVKPTGAKSWIQRLMIDGVRRNIGLGPVALVDVVEAKARALDNRRAVLAGVDPLADKRKAKAPTFAEAVDAVAEANGGRWKESTAYRWRQKLEKNAIPFIGDKRLDQIDQFDVLAILTPIWATKPTLARKLREHCRAVFSWGQAHGYIKDNPAGDMIDGALAPQAAVKSHMRAMSYEDVPAALQAIRGCNASLPARLCLELVILTGCRGGEARAATWDEIDLDRQTWTIPAAKMKAKRDHVIPLSGAVTDLLEQAGTWAGGDDLLFPSPGKRGVMTDTTLLNVLTAAGLREKTTVHGFRSAFRDWCSHRRIDRELAELCLHHLIGNQAEQAYKRSDLLDARRPVMNSWAQYATGIEKPVPSLAVVNG